MCAGSTVGGTDSQAVHGGATLPTLPLPLRHVTQQPQEGLLGVGNVAVRRPAQELELSYKQLTLLELGADGGGGGKGGQTSRGCTTASTYMRCRQAPSGWGVHS